MCEVFVKWKEEGRTYVKASKEGMFGEKGRLMWLEKCIHRANDMELSCKARMNLDLEEY